MNEIRISISFTHTILSVDLVMQRVAIMKFVFKLLRVSRKSFSLDIEWDMLDCASEEFTLRPNC